MKKTLVALAISSVAGFAFAQSNVTLYGIVDGGVGVTQNKGGDTKVQMASGLYQGDRWGLRGVEDLGNGNSVFFQLEQGFSLKNGTIGQNGGAFSRQANLGLRGGWGEFSFGRFGALSSDCGSYTILGGAPYTTSYYTKGNMLSALVLTSRYNNNVVYKTPTISGVTGYAMYSNGTSADSEKWSDNAHYYGIGATYSAGALKANAIIEILDNKGLTYEKAAVDAKKTQLYTLGASYDFGPVALYGAYQYAQNSQTTAGGISVTDVTGAASKNGASQHGLSLGVSSPIAGGNLALQGNYANGKLKDSGLAQDKYSAWSVGAAYTYPLSKRTLVYSYAGYGDAKKALKIKDSDARGYALALGLRHAF